MKRKNEQSAVENHDIRQHRYPMPGTDLGFTNAIPFNEAVDVDASGGRQCDWALGKGDEHSHFSYTDRDKCKELIPADNPTRTKRKMPSWMESVSQPAKGSE